MFSSLVVLARNAGVVLAPDVLDLDGPVTSSMRGSLIALATSAGN